MSIRASNLSLSLVLSLSLSLAVGACDQAPVPEASCVLPTTDARPDKAAPPVADAAPPDMIEDAGSDLDSSAADTPPAEAGGDQAEPDQPLADAAGPADGTATDTAADTAAACCPTHFTYRADGNQVDLMGYPAPLDWVAGITMRRNGGRWQVTVCLPPASDVYFKYRIDGTVWKHDATLSDVVDDSFGGLNNHLAPVDACPAGGRQVGRP